MENIAKMKKPTDPYSPDWALWNSLNPGVIHGVGADVSPAEGDDNGDGEADDGSAPDGSGNDDGAASKDAPSTKRPGLLANANPVDDDAEGAGDADGDPTDKGKDGKQRPEWLPEKFWDAEKGEPRTESMAKAYSTLEKNKGKSNEKAPESADEYFGEGFEVPEGLENVEADDNALKTAASVFHKHGIPVETGRAIVAEFLQGLDPLMPEAIDEEAELEKLGQGGPALVAGLKNWVDGLAASKQFSEQEVARLYQYAGDAVGIATLAKLRNMTGEKPIPVHLDGEGDVVSAEQFYSMHRDPRYGQDAAFTEKVDRLGERIFGDEAAGSSIPGIGYPNRR